MWSRAKILPTSSQRFFLLEYEFVRFLGRGSFGEVWVCRERATGRDFAVKVIDKARVRSSSQRGDILREVGVLEVCQGQHAGLVQLREVLEGPRELHLVMELCRGGDLLHLVTQHGRLPEAAARLVFRQVASALAFCHAKGIIHRDIKPENILFDHVATSLCSTHAASTAKSTPPPAQAKLADFGLAVVVAPGETYRGCAGSKFYVAPEMVKGRPYDSRVDVWSLGVVLCAMLTGAMPFTGKTFEDDEGLKWAILHKELDFKQPHWKGASKGARALIRLMLERDPRHRPTAEELLSHPWVAEAAAKRRTLLRLRPKTQSGPIAPPAKPRRIDLPITVSELDEPERKSFPWSPKSPEEPAPGPRDPPGPADCPEDFISPPILISCLSSDEDLAPTNKAPSRTGIPPRIPKAPSLKRDSPQKAAHTELPWNLDVHPPGEWGLSSSSHRDKTYVDQGIHAH